MYFFVSVVCLCDASNGGVSLTFWKGPYVVVNTTVTAECSVNASSVNASSRPELSVMWMKDNRHICSNTKVLRLKSRFDCFESILIIRNADYHDAGDYSCAVPDVGISPKFVLHVSPPLGTRADGKIAITCHVVTCIINIVRTYMLYNHIGLNLDAIYKILVGKTL